MSDVKITNDGSPEGTRVYVDGEDISDSVVAVTWDHAVNMRPTAEVRLQLVECTMLSGEVRWAGLERVPLEALEAEIRRRKSPTEEGRE